MQNPNRTLLVITEIFKKNRNRDRKVMGLGHERLDVLVVSKALNKQESRERKLELNRIVAMLTRLGGRGYCVKESSATYKSLETDYDCDPDTDFNST